MYKKREGNKLWDSQGKEHGNESNEGTKAKHMDNLQKVKVMLLLGEAVKGQVRSSTN